MTAPAFFLGLVAGMALAALACAAVCARARRRRSERLRQLTEYLEDASLGRARALLPTGEDDLSRLQDEIGKTVMALERTRAAAVDAKEGFARNLSSIAHQVKTPLAVISLAAQRAAGGDPDEARDAAQAIGRQVERLSRLQDDLLLMAKLDAGVLEMRPVRQDVDTLLCAAAESLADYAEARGVSLDVVGEEPASVLVDEHWSCEALMNVMKNCVEHAPAGTAVRVEYEATPLYVEARISDEGPGIAPGEEGRVFERFRTGPGSPSGTGLGLAFARELLGLQDASIRALNRPTGGACFEIRFYGHPDVTLVP